MKKDYKIKEIPFTYLSALYPQKESFGYKESYECEFARWGRQITFEDVKKALIKVLDGSMDPWWMKVLEKIRDKAGLLIGSKEFYTKENQMKSGDPDSIKLGDKFGGFMIFQVLENEVIMGLDDKNMDFRLSVLLDKNTEKAGVYRIIETTTVKYNTWFGKLEFFFIRPFHRHIIIPMFFKQLMAQDALADTKDKG